MYSREQQTLIEMAPDASEVERINGRLVVRNDRGWSVAVPGRLLFGLSLPEALAAVQPEKRVQQ